MENITGKLFYEARQDAVSKVIQENLYGYPRVLDLNDSGLEGLVPPSGKARVYNLRDKMKGMFDRTYSPGPHALIAFDGVEPSVLEQASDCLEKQGVFCYMEQTPFVDLVDFYSSPLPLYQPISLEFNEWLDSMGFSVTGHGTKYGTKTFFKRDAPIQLPEVAMRMYDMIDSAMVVSGVSYIISEMK